MNIRMSIRFLLLVSLYMVLSLAFLVTYVVWEFCAVAELPLLGLSHVLDMLEDGLDGAKGWW